MMDEDIKKIFKYKFINPKNNEEIEHEIKKPKNYSLYLKYVGKNSY